ncbi:WD40/YVTN/BNR-like repeat-containing protein [Paenibacillus phoenicis]|uniref:WD40/YVTN/BNR-like repeat-containing protein n=1 Tax=Paenibacillus phoenicis TaxID=554117 RepID=UPI003D26A0C3
MFRVKKKFSWGFGFYLTVALVLIIIFAIWGGTKKSKESNLASLITESNTHPHVFSYALDDTTVLMGTHTGVYELVDQKWQRTFEPIKTNDVMGIETDFENPSKIYAAGHGFVKRSVDGGDTWETIENGLPNQSKPNEPDAHYLVMDPDDPNHLFTLLAGSENNLFETKDGGEIWQNIGTLPEGAYSITALPGAPVSFLAATETGLIHYIVNEGKVQNLLLTNEPVYGVLYLANGEVILMSESGFLKSKDLKDWSDLHVDLKGEMPLGIKASKRDPNRLVIVTDRYSVFESDNGGSSWSLRASVE